ncbi:hypothetical protein L0669_08550 [Flavobacterium bizetiae]|uniref:hypothetical protein n=1 Tax=Flavobacterium bizetiae TaxID=2704140 RepID=UPI0021E8D96F|nr:hypothetical protein [Flavobacterium bizetiae]UTN05955.1 hypothetical protein L0669_08550 [Flavobacterium bizetiae]
METNEIKNLAYLKKLADRYLRTLKPIDSTLETNAAQIKFVNYYELGCFITNMLKMCVLTLDQETHNNQSINVSLILEKVLEMFPLDEFEFLSEISDMLITDCSVIAE